MPAATASIERTLNMSCLLRHLGLGAKLCVAPGIALLLMLAVAGGSFLAMRQQQETVAEFVAVRTPDLLAAIELEQQVKAIHAGSYQLLAWTTASYSAEQTTTLAKHIAASLPKVVQAAQAMGQRQSLSEAERAVATRLPESVAGFGKAIAAVLDMAEADQSLATTMMIKSEAPFAKLMADLTELNVTQRAAMDDAARQTAAVFHRTMAVGGTVLVGCVLLAGLATWCVRNAILAPVKSIREAASRLKNGDLTVHPSMQGSDEIAVTARAMSNTVETLRGTIVSVNTAVGEIDNALGEIAAGNQDLSVRTELQAAHLHEANSVTARLAQAVQTNTSGAHAAAELAAHSKQRAEHGGRIVAQMVGVMQAITESSKKVHDITGVIDGIAFQTNILALNAAVEAARAGEQGRGFAVVAAEVRTLAKRSATAAAEIKQLIGASSASVASGGALAGQTGSAITQVVEDVLQLHGLVEGIARASGEQNDSVREIAGMLGELDTATQQNSALVEQAAAAAASMRQESARLVGAVGVFRTESLAV